MTRAPATRTGRSPSPGIRLGTVLLWVALVAACAAVLWHQASVRDPTQLVVTGVAIPLDAARVPIVLDRGASAAVTLRFPRRGAAERLAVDVRLSGDADFVFGVHPDGSVDAQSAASTSFCGPPDARGFRQCALPLTKGNVEAAITIAASSRTPAIVAAVGVRHLRTTPVIRHSERTTPFIVALLLVGLPLVWLAHRSLVTSQWLLVGVAVSALTAIDPYFTLSLLLVLVSLFALGRPGAGRAAGRAWRLLVGLVGAVGFLVVMKYGQGAVWRVFADVGGLGLGLPVGVSYFVIRLVDTQLRWYRGEQGDATLREYLCYVLFPATIPAGPIETLDQFRANRLPAVGTRDIASGAARVLTGLAKKVVIADFVFGQLLYGERFALFDHLALAPAAVPWRQTALTLLVSFLFAYTDFSAYSDIAIGAGRLCGYRIRENFRWPILATSLRDFWRRWHMSLSGWCMRNVYFPLVVATRGVFAPLFAVMMVVGLWHATTLSWLAWALHHASGLSLLALLERGDVAPARGRVGAALRRPLGAVLTLGFVVAGHSFVLFGDFPTALRVYSAWWRGLLPW